MTDKDWKKIEMIYHHCDPEAMKLGKLDKTSIIGGRQKVYEVGGYYGYVTGKATFMDRLRKEFGKETFIS